MKAVAALVLRVAAVLILLAASLEAIRLAIADSGFMARTPEGLEKAVKWAPGNATYHRWLAVSLVGRDSGRAEKEFREAIRLNHWDAESRMRLAMIYESKGLLEPAEKELKDAAKVDATFLPRWTLANFEFRRGNLPEFWTWARASAAMSFGDRFPLFDLAAATGETNVAERLDLKGDQIWTNYLYWAIKKGTPGEIRKAGLKVAAAGKTPSAADGAVELAAQRLADLGSVDAALEVWNAGAKSGIVPAGEAAKGRITNPTFAFQPRGYGFDWIATKPEGGAIVRESIQGGLRVRFTGDQAEQSDVLTQRVAVEPGVSYNVVVKYRTKGLGRKSGLKCLILGAAPPNPVAETDAYLWDEGNGEAALSFTAPPGDGLVKVVLRYLRPQGEVRMAGEVSILAVEMKRM